MQQLFTRLGFLSLLMLCGSLHAQDLNSSLPRDPNVVTGTFSNGLTYYVRNNHKPDHKVELRLVVKAGSILESNDQQGLAHFMEHMNFNGLSHFEKNELVNYLQSIGVGFGADLNAYTAFDQTVFILPIPTDKPGNLDKGFQIIEDWAHNALLTDKDIDDERGVVLEESRLGKGADNRMLEKYFPQLASGSLYAQRLPIGKDSILKHFKHDEIRAFYHDWYRPDLQAIIVVGDIDTATAMHYLRQHFAGLKNPVGERKRDYVAVSPRSTPDAMVVTDPEATNSMLSILFSYNKKKASVTVGDYRDDLKRALAEQMLNLRYSDIANGTNPPFPFAGAGFDGLIHGYEAFTVQTMFGDEGPQKVLDALTAELIRAQKYGFTQAELDRAKSQMLNGMEQAYNERTTTESGNYVEEYIRNFLDAEPFPGIEKEYNYYKTLMPSISLEEVNQEPKEWMSNMNTFTLITAPESTLGKLPTNSDLLAMTRRAFAQEVKPLEERTVSTTLMDKKPAPGKVVNQTTDKDLGTTTYTLSNGVKVTIKQTNFKSDEIVMTGVRKGGTNNYGASEIANVRQATDIVDAMGIGNFNPTDLQKALTGKTANVDLSIDDISDKVSGSSSVKDLESMLQLLYLQMTSPRRDEDLFKAFVTKQKQMLMFMSANPQVAYIDTTIKTLYHNSPLAPSPIPKASDFDALDLDRALTDYKTEFGTADGFNFYLVGNIDPAVAIPLLETYLGGLPVSGKVPEYKDNGLRSIDGNVRLDVHKGTDKKSLILAITHGEMPYTEDMALRAQAVAEILNIKVIEELREKMSGIYTGGYFAQLEQEPYSHYSIIMQLPCGPENVDTLLKTAAIEVENLKAHGPVQSDLDKVRQTWHEKHITNMTENSYWAGKLEEILYWGRNKDHILNYDNWINNLKPADIQQAAKQFFNGRNTFISVLYPQS